MSGGNPLAARVGPASDPWGGLRDKVRAPGSGPLDVRRPSADVKRRGENGRFAARADIAASERHPAGARFTIPVARALDQPQHVAHRLKPGQVAIAARSQSNSGNRPPVQPGMERVFSIEEANARFKEHVATIEVCVGRTPEPGAPPLYTRKYMSTVDCREVGDPANDAVMGAYKDAAASSDKNVLPNFAGKATITVKGASRSFDANPVESQYALYGALRGKAFVYDPGLVLTPATRDDETLYASDGAPDDFDEALADSWAMTQDGVYRDILRDIGMDVYVDGVTINLDDDDDGEPVDWSMDQSRTRAVANVAVQGHCNCVAPEGTGLTATCVKQDVLVALRWVADAAEKYVVNKYPKVNMTVGLTRRPGSVYVHRVTGHFELTLLSGDFARKAAKRDALLVNQTIACWRVARVTDTACYRPTNKRPFADAEHLLHVNVAVEELPTAHYAAKTWVKRKLGRPAGDPRRSLVSPLELYAEEWQGQEFRPPSAPPPPPGPPPGGPPAAPPPPPPGGGGLAAPPPMPWIEQYDNALQAADDSVKECKKNGNGLDGLVATAADGSTAKTKTAELKQKLVDASGSLQAIRDRRVDVEAAIAANDDPGAQTVLNEVLTYLQDIKNKESEIETLRAEIDQEMTGVLPDNARDPTVYPKPPSLAGYPWPDNPLTQAWSQRAALEVWKLFCTIMGIDPTGPMSFGNFAKIWRLRASTELKAAMGFPWPDRKVNGNDEFTKRNQTYMKGLWGLIRTAPGAENNGAAEITQDNVTYILTRVGLNHLDGINVAPVGAPFTGMAELVPEFDDLVE